ncbi:galactose-1-phosphate uridylyltransferase [Bifidobacterium bombi]|uniref:Galactose-1-phosphate uridylyltransferase n=1 Tax=Bifidobacterium bombi DSM 19703 TaxID=1341695 RepID=A0A086BPH9_9BIFI|nr:galactose-1-phosphate uridylyltransferase [Bifidobacterium bombi]KFF31843.1 galactose-1-phosphate uridylyltransferase [Bifidobacterium bombi DSM 19703]
MSRMAMDGVYEAIDALSDFALDRLSLSPDDEVWARNRVLALFALDSYHPTGTKAEGADVDSLLNRLREAAVAAGLLSGDPTSDGGGLTSDGSDRSKRSSARAIDDAAVNGDALDDAVMSCFTASPSVLRSRFKGIESVAAAGPMEAMRWFYDYCSDSTYVKRSRLSRNLRFASHGLIVTINLSKPEFRTMKNAAVGNSVSGGYPKCTICYENEGFAGRDKRTLRTIPVTLGCRRWFWQFSPYGYFDQHGICVNAEHTPMHVDRQTFVNLLDFVDRFPGYFLGCNAALPRIGGSVLAHDHYQGGGELMPMHKAGAWATLRLGPDADNRVLPALPASVVGADSRRVNGCAGPLPQRQAACECVVEILDWPGTAVRVVSRSRAAIVAVSDRIREGWVHYSNPGLAIVCEGPEGRRSAVSPSVVVTERGYEMNLILRNNGVSEEFPQGIFHAHPEFWAVKQEPIGLIEAQGLFVLPGRLKDQLAHIEDALVAGGPLPEAEHEFAFEWDELRDKLGGRADRQGVREAIKDELGDICERILGNTAVFKRKEDTLAFMQSLGFMKND